jgi:uncharacterized protein YjdB
MGKLNRSVMLRQAVACGVALTLVAPAVPAGVALADESSSDQTVAAANAEASVIASGKCGENLSWTLDSGYNLVISGNGNMDDFEQGKTPWSSYQDVIQSITVADGATSIGKNAFYECKDLEKVHLADSITSIAENAFYNCQLLTDVNMPKSLTYIGTQAFFLTSITSLDLPEGFTSFGVGSQFGAFSSCLNLTSVSLPSTLTSVPEGTFYYCSSLKKVMLPCNVTSVGDYAFANCDQLIDVYYTGDESAWSKISFGSSSGSLFKATKHYNYVPVSSIALSSDTLQLTSGATQKLGISTTPENASDITWSSSDESVATVDQNGNVTAQDYGSATITAQSPFGMTAQCEVAVPILVGNSVTYEYSGDCSVSTSDSSVARAHITGKSSVITGDYSRTTTTVEVDALKTGRVDITFTPTNGTASTVKHLVVANPLQSITLSADSLQMFEGDTQVITATLDPEDADDGTLDWSSSNESVAKVDGGKITAVASGSATITATNKATGVSSKATVQVYNANQNIAAATVDPVSDQLYTGSPVEPELAVKSADGAQLKAGVDYEVSYASNVDAGTAVATITGIGNYVGTKEVKFNIAPADMTKTSIDPVPDQTYTGSKIEPALAVKSADGTQLKANTDYTVAYASNVDAGTATATITGVGNYAGAKQIEFKIAPADVSEASVDPVPDQLYTGSPVEPELAVRSAGGAQLKPGGDYTVAYASNVDAGTATATIAGAGNYTGTKTVEFNIVYNSSFFSDVNESTPHYKDIMWLASAGISEGWLMPDGTREFRGMDTLKRQDMAAFLYRMAGSPAFDVADFVSKNGEPFSDVNESTPHYKEILWLYSTGISEGWLMPDGTREFRGMDTLKRQDMAAFLYRFDGSPEFDASAKSDPFVDVDANTPHYREVLWLADTGVSEGWHMLDGTSEFRGMENLVRQDMAAFLHRLHDLNA